MSHEQITQYTNDFVKTVEQERNGELSKNGARLAKGYYLTMLEREGMRLKAEGEEMPFTPLQTAITAAKEALESKGVFDTNLGDDEVSIVRKAYVRVAEPNGGLEARFTDHFAVNPHTGMQLVNDAGMPFERSITEVAVNKLYWVSDFAEHDFDASVSFAKRASENALKQINKLWKRTKEPSAVFTLIDDLIQGPGITDETVRDAVNAALGIEPSSPEYKNISVPIDVYEGVWTRSREMMSLILGFNGSAEFLDKDSGRVYIGILIDCMFGTLLDPLDFGPWRMLEVLTRANLLSTEQAANFKLAWEKDGLKESWDKVMETGELPSWSEATDEEE